MNAIIEVKVPISGEKPFLGPMMWRSESSEEAGCARKLKPEIPVVIAAPALRKSLRDGKHSAGIMAVSVQSITRGKSSDECGDDTARLTIEQAMSGSRGTCLR